MRETFDLECKQKKDKGRHGWEIQERSKAAGESVQWYLHPILVKERHVRILEGKAEPSFLLSVCSIYWFKWNLVWERGRDGTACLLPGSP